MYPERGIRYIGNKKTLKTAYKVAYFIKFTNLTPPIYPSQTRNIYNGIFQWKEIVFDIYYLFYKANFKESSLTYLLWKFPLS